jgi:phosphoglycolate phosphatase-like HAD superfamily hydrolase
MADLGIAEGGTLMVGDSLSDLGAARSAGVAVAIVAGGESAADDVAAARPDHHLQRLAEVADLV